MKIKHLLFLFIFFSALQLKAQQPATIPSFTFSKLNGAPFSNANLKAGRSTFFILFDCTCEHCQREVKKLNENYDALKNLNICMVTLDVASNIKTFFSKYAPGFNTKPNVNVLQDTKQTFIPTFLPSSYPSMYVYSSAGKLLSYYYGDNAAKNILKSLDH